MKHECDESCGCEVDVYADGYPADVCEKSGLACEWCGEPIEVGTYYIDSDRRGTFHDADECREHAFGGASLYREDFHADG